MFSPWFSLETIPTQSAVRMVWRRRLHDGFELFRDAFLQPEPDPVTYYPCPYGPGCPHDIVYPGDGSILAVCNCPGRECQPASLTPDDIVAWTLSWSKLGRALANAFGLTYKTAEFGLYNTRQIGSWAADAGTVILTIQSELQHFQHAVSGLLARHREPFILLSPTTELADAVSRSLLANNKCALFSLDSKVILTDTGIVQPLIPPGELFSRFTPQPKELDHDSTNKAYVLVEALDTGHLKPPSLIAVFRRYCKQGLTIAETAKRCGCSRDTIRTRLAFIQQKTGVDPHKLLPISTHLDAIEDQLSDPRATHIHRRRLIDDH